MSQEQYKILRTSKGKEAILHDGFYYNHITTWIRMLMAFPFLVLDDIDDVWDEMKDTCPDTSSKSNVYKILDITKNQETLTSTKFERVNQGQEKKSSNAQHVKDAKIEVLKLKYKHGELDVMYYLLQVSVFSKNYV